MFGTAFNVVIYPEAKKNIFLSLGMVHAWDSWLKAAKYTISVFLDQIGHAFTSLLVWVRLLTQPLLTPRLKPHSINMQPVGQQSSNGQKLWLSRPRKTCGQEFSLLCTTQWRWHAKWQQHLQQSLLKTFWNRQVFFQLKQSWAKLNTPWLNKSQTGICFGTKVSVVYSPHLTPPAFSLLEMCGYLRTRLN